MSAITTARAQEQNLIDVLKQATAALDAIGSGELAAALKALEEAKARAVVRLAAAADVARTLFADLTAKAQQTAQALASDLLSAPDVSSVKQAPRSSDATPDANVDPAPAAAPIIVRAVEKSEPAQAVATAACAPVAQEETAQASTASPPTSVVNARDLSADDVERLGDKLVYVGRAVRRHRLACVRKASPFANHKRFADLDAYRAHVQASPELMALLPTLKGKVLCCWCVSDEHPASLPPDYHVCHAQRLATLADES